MIIDRLAIQRMDAEANAFAMELLMPEEWLRADVEARGGVDIEDEKVIEILARRYKVNKLVMAARLAQLASWSAA